MRMIWQEKCCNHCSVAEVQEVQGAAQPSGVVPPAVAAAGGLLRRPELMVQGDWGCTFGLTGSNLANRNHLHQSLVGPRELSFEVAKHCTHPVLRAVVAHIPLFASHVRVHVVVWPAPPAFSYPARNDPAARKRSADRRSLDCNCLCADSCLAALGAGEPRNCRHHHIQAASPSQHSLVGSG